MMYMRGTPADYQSWMQMGLHGWGYEDVLPYFRRAEHNPERPNDLFHGQTGPLNVEKSKADNPLYRAFLAAGHDEGFPANDDFNGAQQEGLGRYDFNELNGRRVSSSAAYLRPVRHRQNLAIWTKTLVTKIVLADGRAVALDLVRGSSELRVSARREIILSAGAVNSPQLLQLSGIGDPEHLTSLGITPAVNAPEVGRNLQEHLGVYLKYAAREKVTLYSLFGRTEPWQRGFKLISSVPGRRPPFR